MYLTVHKVRAPQSSENANKAGYNVFVYRHGTEVPPDELPIDEVAAKPGELTKKAIEVKPGGNFVDSYLDIVGPDETSFAEMNHFLDEFRNDIQSRTTDQGRLSFHADAMKARVYVSPRVPGSHIEEFDRLAGRARAIWAAHIDSYTIRRSFDGDVFKYVLEEDPIRVPVTISRDTYDDYERLGGNFESDVAPLMLTEEELSSLPSVRIVDDEGNLLFNRQLGSDTSSD